MKEPQIQLKMSVMSHIKLMGIDHRAPYKYILCPYTHPCPLGRVNRSNRFLMKVVMLHIKLKGMEHRALCKHIFYPYTHPRAWDGVKGQNIFIRSHFAHQIKGNGA